MAFSVSDLGKHFGIKHFEDFDNLREHADAWLDCLAQNKRKRPKRGAADAASAAGDIHSADGFVGEQLDGDRDEDDDDDDDDDDDVEAERDREKAQVRNLAKLFICLSLRYCLPITSQLDDEATGSTSAIVLNITNWD